MEDSTVICNKCGKPLSYQDISDQNYNFSFDFGYASHHDGEKISFDLCGNCLDEVLNVGVKTFKYVPEGFKQDNDLPLDKDNHQKVFEHWKETDNWEEMMFYTYEELVELNGYFNTNYLNEVIKKFHPDKPLLEGGY